MQLALFLLVKKPSLYVEANRGRAACSPAHRDWTCSHIKSGATELERKLTVQVDGQREAGDERCLALMMVCDDVVKAAALAQWANIDK